MTLGLTLLSINSTFACLSTEKLLFTGKGGSLKVCGGENYFRLQRSTLEDQIFPIILNDEKSMLLSFIEKDLGEKERSRFFPFFQDWSNRYYEKLDKRVTSSMGSGAIGLIEMINRKDLFVNFDCFDHSYMKSLNMDLNLTQSTNWRCFGKFDSLPKDLREDLRKIKDNSLITFKEMFKNHPQTKVFLRSRVLTNSQGTPREISLDSDIPLESYLTYDLIIESESAELMAIGKCFDWKEEFLKVTSLSDYTERKIQDIGEDKYSHSYGKISESWKIPFGLNIDSKRLRDNDGNTVEALDLTINTGFTFTDKSKNFQIGPSVSHPFLRDVKGVGDAVDFNHYSLEPSNTIFGISGHIKF